MSIRRIFLDWSRPALSAVVEFLLAETPRGAACDLTGLLVVLPTRQAGRRLLELLVEQTGGALCPPQIITVGALPEMLYAPQRPFASLLTQQFVWAEALRGLPAARRDLVVRRPPAEEDSAGWLQLGELLCAQHVELAADRIRFQDIVTTGRELPGFNETERWEILAEVQQRYLDRLDALGLWDQQTARLVAIENGECAIERRIMTVGTVDLNRTMRAMLDQVADKVTAVIHAPESCADLFDAHGCLIPQKWSEEQLEITSGQVRLVDDAAGQAEEILRTLDRYQGRYAPEEITVAVPDEQLVRGFLQTLKHSDVPAYRPVGPSLLQSAPARLLQGIADYLDGQRCAEFSDLLRHPDIGRWLERERFASDWLTDWDDYVSSHLPRQIGRNLPASANGRAEELVAAVSHWLSPLLAGPRPLSGWTSPVQEVLDMIYDTRHSTGSHSEACEGIHLALESHAELPPDLDVTFTAEDALRLTLRELSDQQLAPADSGKGLLLSGWLDMALDDAPAAIVTSLNEGIIPSSINHDLFLPNSLRQKLGIEDNARRYARDCYVLATILHSRQDVQLITARRDLNGDPLAPSRLLFATDPQEIAKRVLEFYDDSAEPAPDVQPRLVPGPRSDFPIPRPQPLAGPPTSFSVTSFRAYLASPYRYYLASVLGLVSVSDQLEELDSLAFGTLLHDVLHRFGQDPDLKDSFDAQEIAAGLNGFLTAAADRLYGADPLPAILIQIEQSRRRLEAFAGWQAGWRQEGWRIQHVEWSNPEPVPFPLDADTTISLRGRIDRIDYHPDRDQWAIFDYKTGEQGKSPQETHRQGDGWIDLQLPLYRHLARGAGAEGDLRLGYLVLPRDTNVVTVQFADWSEEELEDADAVARDVARRILAEEFWVETDRPGGWSDPFDAICQSGVFGQEVRL